jgi:hypothetical protein
MQSSQIANKNRAEAARSHINGHVTKKFARRKQLPARELPLNFS